MWGRAVVASMLPSAYYYLYSSNRVHVDEPPIKSKVPLVFIHGLKGSNLVHRGTHEMHYLTINQALGLTSPDLRLPLRWTGTRQEKDELEAFDPLHSLSIAGVRVQPIYDAFLEWMSKHTEAGTRPCYSFSYDWRRDINENLDHFVAFLHHVADRHGVRVQVIGHSMGGLLTFAAINRAPHLFHSALIGGVPFGPGYGYLKDLHVGSPTGYNSLMFSAGVLFTFASSFWTFPLDAQDERRADTGVYRMKPQPAMTRPRMLRSKKRRGERRRRDVETKRPMSVRRERAAPGSPMMVNVRHTRSPPEAKAPEQVKVASAPGIVSDMVENVLEVDEEAAALGEKERALMEALAAEMQFMQEDPSDTAAPLRVSMVAAVPEALAAEEAGDEHAHELADAVLERLEVRPWDALWWPSNNIGVFTSYETLRAATMAPVPAHHTLVAAAAGVGDGAARSAGEDENTGSARGRAKAKGGEKTETEVLGRLPPPTDEEVERQGELLAHMQSALNQGQTFRRNHMRFDPSIRYPPLAVLSGVGRPTLHHVVKGGPRSIKGWDFESGRTMDGDGRIPLHCSTPPPGVPFHHFTNHEEHQALFNELGQVRDILLWLLLTDNRDNATPVIQRGSVRHLIGAIRDR